MQRLQPAYTQRGSVFFPDDLQVSPPKHFKAMPGHHEEGHPVQAERQSRQLLLLAAQRMRVALWARWTS